MLLTHKSTMVFYINGNYLYVFLFQEVYVCILRNRFHNTKKKRADFPFYVFLLPLNNDITPK